MNYIRHCSNVVGFGLPDWICVGTPEWHHKIWWVGVIREKICFLCNLYHSWSPMLPWYVFIFAPHSSYPALLTLPLCLSCCCCRTRVGTTPLLLVRLSWLMLSYLLLTHARRLSDRNTLLASAPCHLLSLSKLYSNHWEILQAEKKQESHRERDNSSNNVRANSRCQKKKNSETSRSVSVGRSWRRENCIIDKPAVSGYCHSDWIPFACTHCN